MKTKLTFTGLRDLKRVGEKIASLTAYDACFARLLDEAGVDVILVGDSLGMVVHEEKTTLHVTMEDMVYHTRIAGKHVKRALCIADLPYHSYATPFQALENAGRLLDAGAEAVKLEGGEEIIDAVRHLIEHDVQVCGHLGLLPQSIEKYGGFKVQGREEKDAEKILNHARLLEEAGVGAIVLECIPAALAAEISRALQIPTIGIGAGPDCDGQVLVLYDVLGISSYIPRMANDFVRGRGSIREAIEAYVAAVKSGAFPAAEQSFS